MRMQFHCYLCFITIYIYIFIATKSGKIERHRPVIIYGGLVIVYTWKPLSLSLQTRLGKQGRYISRAIDINYKAKEKNALSAGLIHSQRLNRGRPISACSSIRANRNRFDKHCPPSPLCTYAHTHTHTSSPTQAVFVFCYINTHAHPYKRACIHTDLPPCRPRAFGERLLLPLAFFFLYFFMPPAHPLHPVSLT